MSGHPSVDGPTLRDVSDAISALGPFFAVSIHPPAAIPGQPWRPLLDLVEQPGLMMARIDAVRTFLAAGRPVQAVEHRVAASVTHLGLVARLIAPALALVVTTGHPPCTDLSRLWWQDEFGGAFPLSIPDITGATFSHQPTDAVKDAALLCENLIDGPIRALTDAVAATVPVSAHVLQGNIASAINSAATLIGSQRSDLQHASRAAADALLHDPELNPAKSPSGKTFRRSSCCLIYRASPTRTASRESTCGDCILA
ncbi:MAG: hypothetical protein ACYDDU_20260 [Dermatophilaceae bacterium]